MMKSDTHRSTQPNIDREGTLLDAHGNCVGFVSRHGFVYDRQRCILGYVTQQGIIRDAQLHLVGSVTMPGILLNEQNAVVGFVNPQGVVLNRQHHQVGEIAGTAGTFPFLAEVAAFFLLLIVSDDMPRLNQEITWPWSKVGQHRAHLSTLLPEFCQQCHCWRLRKR